MTRLRAGSATDVGRVRQVNQDRVLLDERLWVVADGMGGHQGGEVAAEVAVTVVRAHLVDAGARDGAVGGAGGGAGGGASGVSLSDAIAVANTAVIDRARSEPSLAGMGTTVTALMQVAGRDRGDSDDRLVVANVGDSRTYLLAAGSSELHQITEDHSLVAVLERQGQLSADEAATHPQRNIITRALGVDTDVVVDMWELLPVAGDRYLLCSDGLSNEVAVGVMAEVMRRIDDPDAAAAELVRLANEAGGRDNVTVAIVDVVDGVDAAVGTDPRARITAVHLGGDPVGPSVGTPDPGPATADPATATASSVRTADAGRPAGTGTGTGTGPGIDSGTGTVPTGDGEPDGAYEPPGRRHGGGKRRVVTWRVAVFVVALFGLVGASVGAVAYIARSTYFVGTGGPDDAVVAVFQGRPGGVLWLDPIEVEVTDLQVADLGEVAGRSVAEGHREPTLDAARSYVDRLRDGTSTTTTSITTTTTTTTRPATTPTTRPATRPAGGATTPTTAAIGD